MNLRFSVNVADVDHEAGIVTPQLRQSLDEWLYSVGAVKDISPNHTV